MDCANSIDTLTMDYALLLLVISNTTTVSAPFLSPTNSSPTDNCR